MTETKLPPLIGFTGKAGSGKSAAAGWILRNHGTAQPLAFASPLKTMTYELLRTSMPKGHDVDARAYMTDPERKEAPIPFLGGVSARHIMQTLGTEWGRQQIHPDFWVMIAATKVERLIGSTFRQSDKVPIKVVIDDVRFANEAAMVRAYGGVIVRVERPDAAPRGGDHESETMDFEADFTIANGGSLEDLHAAVQALFPVPPKPPKPSKAAKKA